MSIAARKLFLKDYRDSGSSVTPNIFKDFPEHRSGVVTESFLRPPRSNG
jgi:hypothetical protein